MGMMHDGCCIGSCMDSECTDIRRSNRSCIHCCNRCNHYCNRCNHCNRCNRCSRCNHICTRCIRSNTAYYTLPWPPSPCRTFRGGICHRRTCPRDDGTCRRRTWLRDGGTCHRRTIRTDNRKLDRTRCCRGYRTNRCKDCRSIRNLQQLDTKRKIVINFIKFEFIRSIIDYEIISVKQFLKKNVHIVGILHPYIIIVFC